MAISTMDQLVAALALSQDQKLFFPAFSATTSAWHNYNQVVTGSMGTFSVPAAAGSGGTTYNQSTTSTGIPKWSADGAKTPYIGRWANTGTIAATVHLYDVHWACSGFSGALNTAQTVTGFSGMPARNTNGDGCEIWIGCSGAIGATAHNVTVQYTNQAGTSGRNTVSVAGIASMPSGRMYQLVLQSGDTGVQSVQGITLSASSGTAGNLWVVVMKREASISQLSGSVAQVADAITLGLPALADESCLLFVLQSATTAAITTMGQLSIIQG